MDLIFLHNPGSREVNDNSGGDLRQNSDYYYSTLGAAVSRLLQESNHDDEEIRRGYFL